jgi:hypothetical protein
MEALDREILVLSLGVLVAGMAVQAIFSLPPRRLSAADRPLAPGMPPPSCSLIPEQPLA